MKRGLILASLLSILCASCISGPHYWLDPTDPFRPERSGRLMKITPGLVGLPVAALHDQIESLFYLDPWHFMWTPICSLWLAVSIPAYDIICLPRDLYLRNFAGLEVFVCHPDGTPIRNANILAYEKEAWIERKIGFFETDSRGLAYIPRKSSLVRIKRVDFSEEDSGKPFWMAFEKSSTRSAQTMTKMPVRPLSVSKAEPLMLPSPEPSIWRYPLMKKTTALRGVSMSI